MITVDELFRIGVIAKPHGLAGEVNVLMDDDIDVDGLKRVAIDIDGIYVPFYIDSLRSKGTMTILLKFDGIDNADSAAELCGQSIFVFRNDGFVDDTIGGDRFYISDLIGFDVVDDNGDVLGAIIDVDDSTDNSLFVIETPDGGELLIPVADDFIAGISVEDRSIEMSLPPGLTDL